MGTTTKNSSPGSSLIPIKGISRSLCEILKSVGICDTGTLLTQGFTPAKRTALWNSVKKKQESAAGKGGSKATAEQLVTLQQVNLWVRQADLWRIEGITADAAWLMVQAGVRCVDDLARCNSTTLHNIMKTLATSQLGTFVCPTEETITQYIATAKDLRPKKSEVSNLANLNAFARKPLLNAILINSLHSMGIYRICPDKGETDAADCLTNLRPYSDVTTINRIGSKKPSRTNEKVTSSTLRKIKAEANRYMLEVKNGNRIQTYTPSDTFALDMSDQETPTHLFAEVEETVQESEVVGTYQSIIDGLRTLDLSDTCGLPQTIRGKATVSTNGSTQPAVGILVQLTGFLSSVNDLDALQQPARAYTDNDGVFEIHMPERYNLLSILTFTFINSDGEQAITRSASDIISHLPDTADGTVVCDLSRDTIFALDADKFGKAAAEPKTLPSVRLQGEEGANPVYLNPDTAPARTFRYNLLQRLTVPGATTSRISMTEPINVSAFKNNIRSNHKALCMSNGLSIGYVLGMTQAWVPDGYALGDLLYSLALAPGEEQRIIVRERTESYTVDDNTIGTDRVSDTTSQTQNDIIEEIFSQAAEQSGAASQNSQYSTSAKSRSVSGTLFLASGNAGSASSKGSSSASAQTTSNYSDASQAAERFQTTIASASSRVAQTNRVAIRTATSSEAESVSTKLIANHNHSHIMTVQYWEVMRRYKLQTCVDNVKLVLFVPLSLIPFYGTDSSGNIASTYQQGDMTPASFQNRYCNLVRYADILADCLPYRYRDALTLCREIFCTNNWVEEDKATEKSLTINLTGKFLHEDSVNIYLRTSDGQTIYPTKKDHSNCNAKISPYQPTVHSKQNLSALVEKKRDEASETTCTCCFTLPKGCASSKTFSVVVERHCNPITVYQLSETMYNNAMNAALGNLATKLQHFAQDNKDSDNDLKNIDHYNEAMSLIESQSLSLTESEMIGAAALNVTMNVTETGSETFNITDAGTTLGRSMTATLHRKGTMYFSKAELRRVEELYHHVLNNTYNYSRKVWEGLSDGERVLMLENYTISMDTNGDTGMSETNYPLLNCVDALSPLGFYGNNIVLPFYIPDDENVVKSMVEEINGNAADDGDKKVDKVLESEFSSRTLQDRIYKHHTTDFRVPSTVVSVPTKGMIGEAVLGETNVSELIDITRFWNWKDSDIDHTSLDSSYLGGSSLLANASAPTVTMPTQGATLPQHIQAASILKELAKTPQFADTLSKIDMRELLQTADNNAATGRDNAIKASSEMTTEAIKAAAELAKTLISGGMEVQKTQSSNEKDVEVAKINANKPAASTSQQGGAADKQASGGSATGAAQTACKCTSCANYSAATASGGEKKTK